MWGKSFIEIFPQSSFKFVTNRYNANFSNISLVSSQTNARDFLEYFRLAVIDFLYNFNFRWIYRTTEDCLVDIKLFHHYFQSLDSNYNSTEIVIKGHAVKYCPEAYFIHGGSGWIMSRKAAEKFLENWEILKKRQDADPFTGDDVIVGWFAQHILHLSFEDIDDPSFLGSPYTDAEIEIVTYGYWEKLPKCTKKCYQKQKPIKEIAFWHSGRPDNYPVNIGISAKDIYPPNVYYDQNNYVRQLCIYS